MKWLAVSDMIGPLFWSSQHSFFKSMLKLGEFMKDQPLCCLEGTITT